MNKRGFTLIEIIGAIVILGIIAIIAFATYTTSLRDFRESYYTEEKKTLEKIAQEFFEDNRNYRPTRILNAQEVTLSTLETKEYLDEVIDYNGESCNSESYVMVVKEGTDDYSYHACLICEKDGFDNTKDDKYCDKTWLDPTKVEFGLGPMNKVFIYKDSTKDELREELELPVSYVRKDDNGEIIAVKEGTKEENETILPINIDNVDTNTRGEYKVTYKYGDQEGERVVEVYENLAPTIALEKENVVAIALDGTTTSTRKTYTPGTWAQNVIVTLTAKQYIDESITTARFEWNLNGRWQEFCDTSPCTKKITQEMNQNVQFRVVDSKNHTGIPSDEVRFKIDNTKPSCTLKIPIEPVYDGWYAQNVEVTFNEKKDNIKNNNTIAVSGVKNNNIYSPEETFNRNLTSITKTHTTDGEGIIYKGYVEDEAENFGICEITFKRDTTKPTCTVTKSNTGQIGGVTTTITCDDSGSGVKNCPSGDDGLQADKTYTVTDNVGETGTCSVKVTAQEQTRKKSCTAGVACKDAGCKTYKSCENSTCGYKSCPLESCGCSSYNICEKPACGAKTYSVKVSYSCWNAASGNYGGASSMNFSVSASSSSSALAACNSVKATKAKQKCGDADVYSSSCSVNYVSSYASCATEECGCQSYKACEDASCGYKSCQSDKCDCKTYNSSISKCGCKTWGEYESTWTNVPASQVCTPGESNDHTVTVACRTVYN